jgi:hypothetical protein
MVSSLYDLLREPALLYTDPYFILYKKFNDPLGKI